jgi:uncharacterized protein (DUF433 family)
MHNIPDINSKLGEGIYSIPDIAFLLRLPRPRVRRWLDDFWNSRLGPKYRQKYSWGEGRSKATNFYTLIEFYVFYQLRELKVGPKVIFAAHEEMTNHLNTPFPFASAQILTDGRSILYSLQDGTTVHADKSKQITLRQIIQDFCKKIEFADSQLAERYFPLGKSSNIVVDPHHQFGQPTIAHTNILAQTIYNFHKAGESNNFIAKLYDLPLKDVTAAISLFNMKAA